MNKPLNFSRTSSGLRSGPVLPGGGRAGSFNFE